MGTEGNLEPLSPGITACCNLSLPAHGERPVQSLLESLKFSEPPQVPPSPCFTEFFVSSLQMRWQWGLWLWWPKGNASPARALPTLPALLLVAFLQGQWQCPLCTLNITLQAAPPHTARERRNHPTPPILQCKPQKPHENLPLTTTCQLSKRQSRLPLLTEGQGTIHYSWFPSNSLERKCISACLHPTAFVPFWPC